jgi:hypothetical protein
MNSFPHGGEKSEPVWMMPWHPIRKRERGQLFFSTAFFPLARAAGAFASTAVAFLFLPVLIDFSLRML